MKGKEIVQPNINGLKQSEYQSSIVLSEARNANPRALAARSEYSSAYGGNSNLQATKQLFRVDRSLHIQTSATQSYMVGEAHVDQLSGQGNAGLRYSVALKANVIVVGADNHPHMLDKTQYSSWASRMLLYIKGNKHDKLLLDSVMHGPFKYGTVIEPRTQTTLATVRDRRYDELTDEEKIREACDIRATNIVVQGLPEDIYNLVNYHTKAKEI
nr:hypothetical protein [Tanacetum cinerariifolium]